MSVVFWSILRVNSAEYGVYMSFDEGVNWVRSDAGLESGVRVNDLEPTPRGLVAATDSGVYLRLNGPGGGWEEVKDVPWLKSRILDLAGRGDGTVAVATASRGLWISRDGGGSWLMSDASPSMELRSLWLNGEGLWVGTERMGIHFSADLGQTWEARNAGVPDLARVFALVEVSRKVYAALYQHGLVRWERSASSWHTSGPVTPLVVASSGGNIVIGHNPGGIFWSLDAGTTWNMGLSESNFPVEAAFQTEIGTGLPDQAAVWQMAGRDRTLLSGAADGVFISHNSGRTWSRVAGGIPDQSPGIAFSLESRRLTAVVQIQK